MKKQRFLFPVIALFVCSVACVAQDWQPAVVRDISDSGKQVQVREDHGELHFAGSGDISQTLALQTVDSVYFIQRTAEGRFAHIFSAPLNTKAEVKFTDNGKKLVMDVDGEKFHFNVLKEMTPQQYVAIPLARRHTAMAETATDAPQNAALE